MKHNDTYTHTHTHNLQNEIWSSQRNLTESKRMKEKVLNCGPLLWISVQTFLWKKDNIIMLIPYCDNLIRVLNIAILLTLTFGGYK